MAPASCAHRLTLASDWSFGGGPLVRGAEGQVHYDEGITDEDWEVANTDVEDWLSSASTEPTWESARLAPLAFDALPATLPHQGHQNLLCGHAKRQKRDSSLRP